MLGSPDPASVMAVGDSLPTDIAGATAAGITGVLVTGGIHAGDLGVRMGEAPAPEALARLCDAKGIWPSAAIPAFRW
ncbi:HAD-hyrolase-like [Limimonas halophila]|nr:HAD hydrolase-like protein [Limimonas halophila]SDG22174.1 HAD-hyrolase-like [Limimonas halophila]